LIAVLKAAVKQSGLSLNTIAKESGLSQSQLSRFVSNERTLSLESAAKLFSYFKLRVVDAEGKEVVEQKPAPKKPAPKKPAPKKPK
jgi:transcriptional regulator with XRE-family HTH domain